MKYSILVPSYDPKLEKRQMFLELMDSIEEHSRGRDYELIIRKNGPSYVESHNDALKTARGDWLVVLNDDVRIEDPEWLEKMTEVDEFNSWRYGDFEGENWPDFACWSMSRQTFEKIGLMDEAYKDGYNYEDTDYCFRIRELGIPFHNSNVRLHHHISGTFKRYYDPKQIIKNEMIFREKWGRL